MKKIILISILALLLVGCKKQEPKHYRVVSARYIVDEYDELKQVGESKRLRSYHKKEEYIEVVAENKDDIIKVKEDIYYVEMSKRNEVIEHGWGYKIYLTKEVYNKLINGVNVELDDEGKIVEATLKDKED